MVNGRKFDDIATGIKRAEELGMIPSLSYNRISDVVQDEGNSREYQEESAKRYAEKTNLFIVDVFNIIESAKKEGRKAFNQMLDLALYFGIKDLIFKSSDRMSRNFPDLNRIEKLVDEDGFRIHFFQDHRIFTKDSTHTDRMYLGIETTINKHWSDKISYDVRQANKHKAMNGVAPCRSPFGYQYNKEKKQHEIDPGYEKNLRYIFDEFDSGNYTLTQFIHHLHDKGIYTKSGKKWTKGNLHGLLTKIFYTGCFIYHGEVYPGTHEPYISRYRYELRLRKFESGFNGNIQGTHTFLLTKFIKCGSCGRILTGDKKKDLYTYYKHECPGELHQAYLPESMVFEMLDVAVRDMRYSPDFAENVKTLVRQILEERASSNRKRKIGIEDAIENLSTRRERIIDLWADGDIDRHVLRKKLTKMTSEHEILTQRLNLTDADYTEIIYGMCDLIDELRDNPVTFLSASYEEKAELLHLMAEGAVIHGETMQILWKEPYSFLLTNDILNAKRLFEADSGKKNRLSGLSPNSLSKLPVIDETLTVAMNTAITEYEFYYVRQKSA